jgi:hypothetical protein
VNNSDSNSIELVSVHIPKTAGTSFRDILIRIYGANTLVWDYDDTPLDPAAPYNAARNTWSVMARGFVEKIAPDMRAIHGHFPLRKYEGYFPHAKRIAWVRHPIDRLLSHFFMWRTRDDWPNHTLQRRVRETQMDLTEFAAIPLMRNVMTRVFLEGFLPSSLFFIGIQEHYQEDLKLLGARMGWRKVQVDSANVQDSAEYLSLRRQVFSDRRLLGFLTDLNREDISFYESVIESRRIDDSGDSLWNRLKKMLRN